MAVRARGVCGHYAENYPVLSYAIAHLGATISTFPVLSLSRLIGDDIKEHDKWETSGNPHLVHAARTLRELQELPAWRVAAAGTVGH